MAKSQTVSVAFLAAIVIASMACRVQPPEPPPEPSDSFFTGTPGFFYEPPGEPRGAIVFVHGILGDAEGTWKNQESGAYFPDLAAKEIPSHSVYVYEYTTPILRNSLNIQETALDLKQYLKHAGILELDDVVIVAHSMGGLIARELIDLSEAERDRFSLLFLLSTPTLGSHVAGLGRLLSRNPQLGQMAPFHEDGDLAKSLRSWLERGIDVESYCAYEDQDTLGIRVVTMESATALCDKVLSVVADHIEIAKPSGPEVQPFVFFVNAFRETRPSLILELKPDWSVLQAARQVARTKTRDGRKYGLDTISCPQDALSQAVGLWEAPAGERAEEVLEKLIGAATGLAVKAERKDDAWKFEVTCSAAD